MLRDLLLSVSEYKASNDIYVCTYAGGKKHWTINFNFVFSFILIHIWRQMVWTHRVCSIGVGHVDFKMKNTPNERRAFNYKISIIISYGIYTWNCYNYKGILITCLLNIYHLLLKLWFWTTDMNIWYKTEACIINTARFKVQHINSACFEDYTSSMNF